jgi:uncharacterized repeat protein (TIGR03847 family)
VLIELDPVDRITAGAVGPPGERTFYLQGRRGGQLVTLMLEKQQVQLLAASVIEILSRVGRETEEGPAEEDMELEDPLVPEWRAGRLSIGYQEERDLVLLEAEEAPEESDEDDEEFPGEVEELVAPSPPGSAAAVFGPELRIEDPEDAQEAFETRDEAEDEEAPANLVRFWATREQMLSLARHGAAVCAQGRPICPRCGEPIDPEGHVCRPRCQLCGNRMDPEGHLCPALNGHHKPDEA